MGGPSQALSSKTLVSLSASLKRTLIKMYIIHAYMTTMKLIRGRYASESFQNIYLKIYIVECISIWDLSFSWYWYLGTMRKWPALA